MISVTMRSETLRGKQGDALFLNGISKMNTDSVKLILEAWFSRIGMLILFAGTAYGCASDDTPNNTSDTAEETPLYPKTAGFISIPERPVAFNGFGFVEAGVTTAAEIFYSFVPAKTHSAKKPVFVFLNGGPGAATSSALGAWGTGPYTLSSAGDFVENPGDFSNLGNLIYIDTRQTGFSFDEMPNPSDEAARAATFGFLNYNVFTDAADIFICLLEILEKRPELEDNPMVIVAESYGGARSAVLLSFALDPSSLESTSAVFQDKLTAQKLRDHFTRIGGNDPAAAAARQFERQVLIQPGRVLPMWIETAHTLYALCDHLDDTEPRKALCNGDDYDYSDLREPAGFFDLQTGIAQSVLMSPDGFETMFGIGWEAVPLLRAENRSRAFRFAGEDNLTASDLMGAAVLKGWDAHHVRMHLDPYLLWQLEQDEYASYDSGEMVAKMFVSGLLRAHTFITDAYYDFAVDSRALPAALLEWNTLQVPPVLSDARFISDLDASAARLGWIELTAAATDGSTAPEPRIIRMPTYSNSGHMVPMYQPEAFMEDVRAFLLESGLDIN